MKLLLIFFVLFMASCSHLMIAKDCHEVEDMSTDNQEQIFVCRQVKPWD